ncbi:MAG: tRNA guanosine(34) transglycosylase Tgt [Myxococcota bacterium]
MEAATAFGFALEARDGAARCGRLRTPHGEVSTPAFMSVATYGSVRGVSMDDLRRLGAQIVLANTYHLHERPGEEVVAGLGGLHGFTGWTGPWLTDSGGYQVTSLAHRVKVAEEGITFASPLDGARRTLTPESVVAIQEALGPDIAMVLDECLPPGDHEDAPRLERAMERTLRWARRAAAARRRPDQALFGIVQGGLAEALRRESARATAEIGFDGYAHGGLGLGEERAHRVDLVAAAQEALPPAAPRYLMGLGRPVDLLDAIAAGVDLFDCVVPSRNARHGVIFTRQGLIHIKNARFRDDARPLDPGDDCAFTRDVSRAYLRHLFVSGEALGPRLATLHNLRFYLKLLEDARAAIRAGTFEAFRAALDPLLETRAD